MKLLGIETSGHVGSVALSLDGRIDAREFATPREQTERLLVVVDELLAGAGLDVAGLDGIAFGRGPGSFTGLRIAAAVAQGLAAPTRVPLLPVSSLLCLAQRALRSEGVEHSVACVDAHMGEVYWGEFELRDGLLRAAGPERLGSPSELAPPRDSAWVAVGSGFAAQREALAAVLAQAAARAAGARARSAGSLSGGGRGACGGPRGGASRRAAGLPARAHRMAPGRLSAAPGFGGPSCAAVLGAGLNYFVTMLDCNGLPGLAGMMSRDEYGAKEDPGRRGRARDP